MKKFTRKGVAITASLAMAGMAATAQAAESVNVARTVSDYELLWVTILIMGLLGCCLILPCAG